MLTRCCSALCTVSTFIVVVGLWNAGHAAEPVEPIPGPAVLLFNDGMGGLKYKQFAVFPDGESPRNQFIEEKLLALKMPGSAPPTGFLGLLYNVSGAGAWNGFYLKLGEADWSGYWNGEIVLRLRLLDPSVDRYVRGVDIGQPNTSCTTNFKLELKVKDKTGRVTLVPLRQRVSDAHLAEQKTKGYFDLRVRLSDFSLDLQRAHELVIVFENSQFRPTEYRGALAIRGIALTKAIGDDVDALLKVSENER